MNEKRVAYLMRQLADELDPPKQKLTPAQLVSGRNKAIEQNKRKAEVLKETRAKKVRAFLAKNGYATQKQLSEGCKIPSSYVSELTKHMLDQKVLATDAKLVNGKPHVVYKLPTCTDRP